MENRDEMCQIWTHENQPNSPTDDRPLTGAT